MARKSLEMRISRGKQIKQQIVKLEKAENEHVEYYISNIIRIIFGRKPHNTSPYNIFNNSDLGDY